MFNYNFKKKITLDELLEKERPLWLKTKDRISKGEEDKGGDDDDDEDDFDDDMGDDWGR